MAFPEEPKFLPPDELIFGGTASMQQVRSAIERIAHANLPVLIQGESGTGKEILARVLHSRSASDGRVFLKIHCPPIPGRPESELFQPLSQTGPSAEPPPAAAAETATLFLDDVAELDSAAQVRVLQLLEASPAHDAPGPGIAPPVFALYAPRATAWKSRLRPGDSARTSSTVLT